MPKSAGKGKKEKAKPPKVVIKELTEQNEALTLELNTLKNDVNLLRNKLSVVNTRMIAASDAKLLRRNGVTNATDPAEVPLQALAELMDKLVVKRRIQNVSVEARLEELEMRMSQITFDLARMTKKCYAYESGLENIKSCSSLSKVRDSIYELQFLAGQAYHDVLACDAVHTDKYFAPVPGINGADDKPDGDTTASMELIKHLNLVPPAIKGDGHTTVDNMNKELRLYLINELSQEKASGADWRMLASRVGIDETRIDTWRSSKLAYPMGLVFDEWQLGAGATMRMLHRHLMSPPMRCTLLAKRVADFYTVD